MRRHAKASTAGSTQRQAAGLGRFFRGAFATRAFSPDVDGRGTPSHGRARSQRVLPLGLASLLAFLLLAALAPVAGATQYQRPLVEEVGSVEQPSFTRTELLAVDQATGDVLLGQEGGFHKSGKLYRYHSDGTPAPFAALETNVLDGKAGPGGKPCAEEPASCDQTPQNILEFRGTQITIDNSGGATDGNIYVTERTSNLVDIFSSEGKYLGQLTASGFEPLDGPCGVAVDPSGDLFVSNHGTEILKYVATGNAPVNSDYTTSIKPEGLISSCKLAMGAASSAGSLFAGYESGIAKINLTTGELSHFVSGYGSILAVDPTTGNLLAKRVGAERLETGVTTNKEVGEFSGSGETAGTQLSLLVAEVNVFAEKPNNGIADFAVNSSGNVDLAYYRLGFAPTHVLVYGEPAVVPTVEVNLPADITGRTAILTGSVNPSGVEVTECYFEWGEVNKSGFPRYTEKAPCEGSIPTDSNDHAVHARISGLEPNGKEYVVRLLARDENGAERTPPKTFLTAHTVATEAATELTPSSATLNGTLLPEGLEYSECFFEWGLNSTPGYEHKSPCYPPAPAIEPSAPSQAVSAAISELEQNTTYHFRLVATNPEGTQFGDELTFTSLGLPEFTEIRARDAGQSSVVLEAKIDPSGSGTSYHFEWGAATSYGTDVPPDVEPFIGSGTEPVKVTAKLNGLATGTLVHYRVVATNAVGTASSGDQEAETLGPCGLPDGRCFELVSPRDAGPVAVPGENRAGAEVEYQAAPSGPGAEAYVVESGFPDSTSGAEILYLSRRDESGWGEPTQLKPPINAVDERVGGSGSGSVKALNDAMTCGVVESFMPLTEDASALETRENGGSNLYRTDTATGDYTILTRLPSESGPITDYGIRGMSADCNTVAFETKAEYPGIPGEGKERLYEWRNGTLRNLGVVPGPEEEKVTEAREPGGDVNAVSEDGSRIFFEAKRKTSPISSEVNKWGVFVREGGETTRDLSLSQTATADKEAKFQWATPDGSKVFFTANAGLTAESSPAGTDLYEYDLEAETLTDLSVDPESGGAQVKGFVAASEDGSRVYFVAQGKFVPGKGKTLAENEADGSVSLYSESHGEISYVGIAGASEGTAIGGTSRTTPDGRYLVFETGENVTGYEPGGGKAVEAYLYDALGGSDGTVCVSCRQDGLHSVTSTFSFQRSVLAGPALNPLHPLSSLAERAGKPVVFFTSPDPLAPGAVNGGTEGGMNLYEWAHGQVYLIDRELPGAAEPEGRTFGVSFDGSSADGSDLYLTSQRMLTWEDGDERGSVYDARIGGGFPEPPSPTAPCNANTEGSCQSPSAPAVASPTAGTSTYSGSGNPKEQKNRHGRKHKKKRHRKHRKLHGRHGQRKHHKTKRTQARHANGNRRAGK